MGDKQPKKPGFFGLIGKTIAVIFLGALLVQLALSAVELVSGATDLTKVDRISSCAREYYERDYAELNNYLLIYDLYEDVYDVYWEAVDGYNTLVCYYQNEKAAQMGVDGAQEQAQSLYQKLEEMAQKPEFSQNAKILQEFLEDANAFKG